MTTWFCDAYAAWQKGSVENANGRLRRHLPRDLDIDALGDAELQEIILSHNLDPAPWIRASVRGNLFDLGSGGRTDAQEPVQRGADHRDPARV